MGEAKRRGTLEQRRANAPPKLPQVSALEQREAAQREFSQAMLQAMEPLSRLLTGHHIALSSGLAAGLRASPTRLPMRSDTPPSLAETTDAPPSVADA